MQEPQGEGTGDDEGERRCPRACACTRRARTWRTGSEDSTGVVVVWAGILRIRILREDDEPARIIGPVAERMQLERDGTPESGTGPRACTRCTRERATRPEREGRRKRPSVGIRGWPSHSGSTDGPRAQVETLQGQTGPNNRPQGAPV